MDVVKNNYMPGDPRLIDQIVYELKSQGIFDQFRKECISDVDTKPAYQNLRQRVEGSVTNFLNKQCWRPDMNKNQVREQLRKTIYESGYLETGVERIVDQVVNPKINTVFLPKIEEIVYRFLGLEKPTKSEQEKYSEKKTQKIDVADLLPTDLEAVSPESVNNDHNDLNDDFKIIDMKLDNVKDESFNSFENNDSSSKADEDESPPFEPLEEPISAFVNQEENSVDSNLSGFSGLASHDSNHSFDTPKIKTQPTEVNNDSHMSQNSSEDRLSIVTSEGTNSKMEISEDSQEKEINNLNNFDKKIEATKFDESEVVKFHEKIEPDHGPTTEKDENKKNDIKDDTEIKKEDLVKSENNVEDQKKEENKYEEKKVEDNKDKKSRSSDKHKSSKRDKDKTDDKPKDKNDHKDKRSSSTSKDKDKDKTKESSSKTVRDKDYKSSSKHSSSSKKDKKDEKPSSSRDKDKDKREKDKAGKGKTGDKDKERSDKSSRDKDKSDNKEKRDKDKESKEKENKEKRDKEKTEKTSKDKERDRTLKENKDKGDKNDKHKDKKSKGSSSSNGNSVSSTKKELSSSSSSRKEDKDKSRSSSISHNRDKDKKDRDKKSSSEKHKSDKEKDSLSVSSQNNSKHVTSKKNKEKDKDKKSSKDDHYSNKDKKRERRSTDRDSNDGSGKMSRNSSFIENSNTYSSEKKTEKETSFSSGSGGDSSGNSDQNEKQDYGSETQKIETPVQVITAEVPEVMQKFKYIKPKFASNMKEAIQLMKIRKELAKLERQNQLALAEVKANNINMDTVDEIKLGVDNVAPIIIDIKPKLEEKIELVVPVKHQEDLKEKPVIVDEEPLLQSTDLSPERWEELEAKLAQEMSLVNSKSYYGWDEDDMDMYEVEKDKSTQKISEDKDNKRDVNQEKSKEKENNSDDLDKDLSKDQSASAKIDKKTPILNISPDGQAKQGQKKRKLTSDKSVFTSDKEAIKKLNKSPSKKEDMSKCVKVTESKILNEEIVISPKSKNKRRKISEDNKVANRSIEVSSSGETEDSASNVKKNERKQDTTEDLKGNTHKRDKARKLSEDKTRIDNKAKSSPKYEHKREAAKIGETKQNVKVILKNVIKNKDKQKRLSGDKHETDKSGRKVTIKDKRNAENVKVNDLKKSLTVLIEKKEARGIGKRVKNGKKDDRTLVVHLEKLQGYNGQSLLRNDICEDIQDKIEDNDSSGEFLGFPTQGRNEIVLEEIITDTEDMSNNLILVEDENKIEENLVIEETVLMDENICTEIISEDIIVTDDGENILLGEESEIILQKAEEENHIQEENEVKVSEGPMLIVEDDGSLELSEEELEEIKNIAVNSKEGAIVCELEIDYDNQNAQDQILFKVKDDKKTKTNGTLQELKIEFDPKNTCCQYLEKPTVEEEKKLQTIHEFIEKLEKNVEELSLKIHNNIPKVVNKVGRKRKVIGDAKNNNKAAKRSRQSSVNSEHLSKNYKGQLCNTSSGTDISLNGSFSLPLSPADSDKDLDNKKDESSMSIQTKRKLQRVPVEKRQCYSSDDLYKPRLVFSTSSRRSRGANQSEN